MKIAIIEETVDKNLADLFERFIHERVEQAVSKKFQVDDEFDALALLNKTKDMDQRVLIVELNKEEPEKETAFFEALAHWEANNGLTVFKAIYYNDENGEAKVTELAKKFIEKVYKVKLEEEKKPILEENMPGTDVEL